SAAASSSRGVPVAASRIVWIALNVTPNNTSSASVTRHAASTAFTLIPPSAPTRCPFWSIVVGVQPGAAVLDESGVGSPAARQISLEVPGSRPLQASAITTPTSAASTTSAYFVKNDSAASRPAATALPGCVMPASAPTTAPTSPLR